MKTLRYILLAGVITFAAACEKDNYDGPTAGLSGRIIDADTKQLVEQDIIRGTTIEITEHGYDPVKPQVLIVKTDGTYENSMLFENMYTVKPMRGNFIDVPAQDIQIKGKTVLDFSVTPYLRVLDLKVEKAGSLVVATFKLEQNVVGNVVKIGIYADKDRRVGEPMRLGQKEQDINAPADPNTTYRLEYNPDEFKTQMPLGKEYWFRVGALISVGEAKFNYAAPVKLAI